MKQLQKLIWGSKNSPKMLWAQHHLYYSYVTISPAKSIRIFFQKFQSSPFWVQKFSFSCRWLQLKIQIFSGAHGLWAKNSVPCKQIGLGLLSRVNPVWICCPTSGYLRLKGSSMVRSNDIKWDWLPMVFTKRKVLITPRPLFMSLNTALFGWF